MRIGRELWRLLLLVEVLLGAVLAGASIASVALAADEAELREVLGSALLVVAGASFLTALGLGGATPHVASVSRRTAVVVGTAKPPLVLAADDPQATNRRRDEILARRDEAIVAGLVGFLFLGFAGLLVVSVWLCVAVILGTLGSVGEVLWATRSAIRSRMPE